MRKLMRQSTNRLLIVILIFGLFWVNQLVFGDQDEEFDVLDVMYEELQRSFQTLQDEEQPSVLH